MAFEADDLNRDWEELREAGVALATLLTDAAERLAGEGLPPTASLTAEVRQFRSRLTQFRNRIDPECPAERAATEEYISYSSVEATLGRHAERSQLRQLLERVLTLRHVDDPDYLPLETCREEARRLLDESTSSDDTAWQLITRGRHPLQALVTQIEGAPDLSDDEWAELGDRLTGVYGRSLATAAARGKLFFGEVPVPPAKLPASPAEGANAGLSATTLPESAIASAPPPLLELNESIYPACPDLHAPEIVAGPSFLDSDCPFNPLNPSSSLTQALNNSQEEAPSSPAVPNQASVPTVFSSEVNATDSSPALNDRDDRPPQALPAKANLTQAVIPVAEAAPPAADTTIFDVAPTRVTPSYVSVDELAAMAASADEPRRGQLLADLQIELLRTGRYGMAYQVTRCLEQRTSRTRNSLPLWLVRALALGEQVVFPKGKLALQLQDDFGEFRRDTLLRRDNEWNEALGFFLRAAAIRPAVLAPQSRAAGILQAVGINENLCNLYNYCSRIVRFADQDQGDVLQQLRPNEYEAPRSQEYRQLLREMEIWRNSEAGHLKSDASQTDPLRERRAATTSNGFHQTNEPDDLAQCRELEQVVNHLLAPVTANELREAGWVRQEIYRLTTELERRGSDNSSTGTPWNRFDAPRLNLSSEEMRRTLTDAVGFAQRWLALQGPLPPEIGDAFVSNDLQELRNSILERHEPGLIELLARDQDHDSRLISAGIAVCRRAMQNVHDLFDPRVAPPSCEPEIRHVLNGELLKIPQLGLNARWEPILDLLALETELLELLSKPDPRWADVWQMHCQRYDHAATERLLELDVWGNHLERQALERERLAEMTRCRETLGREIGELKSMLHEISEAGGLSQFDQSGFSGRLDRLEKVTERSTDFDAVEGQLAQVRTALERKRGQLTDRRSPSHLEHSTVAEPASASTSSIPVESRNGHASLPAGGTATAETSHRESVWVMDFN